MQSSHRVERGIRLHHLRMLMTVAQVGSMNKAAALLNTTQPAISRSIAELENLVGVRLLDRNRQGVAPTEYGRALLNGGVAVFDDLNQAMKNIEFLADPSAGEIRIGGNEAFNAGLLTAVFARLRRKHPGISIHVTPALSETQQYRELRERNIELFLGSLPACAADDMNAEILFHDRIVVVASAKSSWGRRRKVELRELANEPWCVPRPEIGIGAAIGDAFRACGMKFPPKGAAMGSIPLFCALLASEPFVSTFPASALRLSPNLPPIKPLPLDLRIPPWPIGIMTLKKRTLSPAVQLFIDCARDVVKPLVRASS